MKKLLTLSFLPVNIDLALLIFRIWVCISLFYKHGIEKFNLSAMISNPHAPDPLHIGVLPGTIWAFLADSICSLLIMLGLATRLAASVIVINLLVVFIFLHGFSFMGDQMDSHGDHAEVVYLYLGYFLYLMFVGAGKYSLDRKLFKQ
jgi:putative oxidoreductase